MIRALWTTGPEVSFTGRHYRIAGATPGPAPAHDINIWLGAYQPRMLGLVGRVADGWVPSSPYLPPEQLPAANQIIDAAAVDAGRSPDAVRRIYNIGGEFNESGKDFFRARLHCGSSSSPSSPWSTASAGTSSTGSNPKTS